MKRIPPAEMPAGAERIGQNRRIMGLTLEDRINE